MSGILIIGDHCGLREELSAALATVKIAPEYATDRAEAIERMRAQSFSVVITDCESVVDEDLALLAEMRGIRPGVKCIVVARESTPDKVIAALQAHVFACYTPPFNAREIARVASYAAGGWGLEGRH